MALFHSKVYGIVQGVGFRPFVSRLAAELNIFGSVCNKGPYVEIFAQGPTKNLEQFFKVNEKFQEKDEDSGFGNKNGRSGYSMPHTSNRFG